MVILTIGDTTTAHDAMGDPIHVTDRVQINRIISDKSRLCIIEVLHGKVIWIEHSPGQSHLRIQIDDKTIVDITTGRNSSNDIYKTT